MFWTGQVKALIITLSGALFENCGQTLNLGDPCAILVHTYPQSILQKVLTKWFSTKHYCVGVDNTQFFKNFLQINTGSP